MTDDDRRALHQLVLRATDKDQMAAFAIEERVLALNGTESIDDVTFILQTLQLHGLDALHQRIVTRLQESQDYWRRAWPSIA